MGRFSLGAAAPKPPPAIPPPSKLWGILATLVKKKRDGAKRQEKYTYLDDPDAWLEAKRKLRALIERSFAQLKQHFGLKNLHIRGLTQVAQYLLSRCTAYIACVVVAHQVGRPDLKASLSRLLWSYWIAKELLCRPPFYMNECADLTRSSFYDILYCGN